MNHKEKYFFEKLQSMPHGATPGFVLQAYQGGKLFLDVEWGQVWKYYDLASLTKIMFTLPWVMRAYEERKIHLADDIKKYLPWYSYESMLENILSHTAGNDWWRPFYKDLDPKDDKENKKNELRRLLNSKAPSKSVDKAIYSDLDFLLLGFLIENTFEKEWLALSEEMYGEMGLEKKIFFQEDNKLHYKKEEYAPTEKCAVRDKQMQGEVHDLNTWALGGVAPHAGLFGTVDGVAAWGLEMRKILLGKSKWLKSATLKKFISPAIPSSMGDWGLGFVLPTPGSSTSGQYFSPKSFGHTGFTGTSFWMDTEKDLFVVILSNRIYPTIKNEEFKKWRPILHDWVVESLQKEK